MAINPAGSSRASAASRSSRAQLPAPYAQYQDEVMAAARRFHIPPEVLFGVMMRESNGQNIRGDGGHGRGLMQIDDRSHGAWLSSHNGGMDPASNIMHGAEILRSSIDAFGGDIAKGLAAYNAGVGGVQSALRAGRSADSATTGGDAEVQGRAWRRLDGLRQQPCALGLAELVGKFCQRAGSR
jgi:soluble lytic murein transglycosylase-like protein